jgi:hypothetical protein
MTTEEKNEILKKIYKKETENLKKDFTEMKKPLNTMQTHKFIGDVFYTNNGNGWVIDNYKNLI